MSENKEQKELEWMPVYWDRFLSATTHFDAAEIGGYMLLIAHQWKHGFIPSDLKQQKKIARVSSVHKMEVILTKFVQDGPGKMINIVCRDIRTKQIEKWNATSKRNADNIKKRYQKTTSGTQSGIQNNRIIEQENNSLKDSKEEELSSTEKIIPINSTNEIYKTKLLGDAAMIDAIQVQTRKTITPENLKDFNAHLFTEGKVHLKYNDYTTHYRSWLNTRPESIKTQQVKTEEFSSKATEL